MMEQDFFSKLASEAPTPGGGTVAAYAAAMGAALLAMVAKLSKKNSSEAEAISKKAEYLMQECFQLANRDAKAFELVVAAYKLPKETETQKLDRQAAIEQSLQKASEVPLESAQTALQIIKLAESFYANTNRHALSDLGVSVLLGEGALEGALYNVFINLSNMKDKHFVGACLADAETILEEGRSRAKQTLDQVIAHLKESVHKNLSS